MDQQTPMPPRLADIYGAKRQEELAQRAQQQGAPQSSAPAPGDGQPVQVGALQRPPRLVDAFAPLREQLLAQKAGKA